MDCGLRTAVCVAACLALAFCANILSVETMEVGDNSATMSTVGATNIEGALITNSKIWYDHNSEEITAGYGFHISQLDGKYYWIGNEPNPGPFEGGDSAGAGEVHIDSSWTLGSNDWHHEGRARVLGRPSFGWNCCLLRSPATNKYVIVSKGGFYESSGGLLGDYRLVNSLEDSAINHPGWWVGGMSAFREGDEAFVIISRRNVTSTSLPRERRGVLEADA